MYVEEFKFSSERPRLILRDIKKKYGGCGRVEELSELFTVSLRLQDEKK